MHNNGSLTEDHDSRREFDATPDVQAYLTYRLGPSPRIQSYAPALVTGVLAALPTIGVIGGLILFGPPPLSALPSFLELLVPAALLLALTGYFVRKARSPATALPTAFFMDRDGVYFRRQEDIVDLIDWDAQAVWVTLLDKREFRVDPRGATHVIVAGGGFGGRSYPVPAALFDSIVQEAEVKGWIGRPTTITTVYGKGKRRVISRNQRKV